jgi:hypothetical protein
MLFCVHYAYSNLDLSMIPDLRNEDEIITEVFIAAEHPDPPTLAIGTVMDSDDGQCFRRQQE